MTVSGQRNDANLVLDSCPGSDSVSELPLRCDCFYVNPESKGASRGVSETNRLFSLVSILEVIFPKRRVIRGECENTGHGITLAST